MILPGSVPAKPVKHSRKLVENLFGCFSRQT